ncbi:MAG: Hsp20/alpha crystallin family protein [Bacteroidia bacterium]
MTLVKSKKNGNGNLFPKLVNDFFDTDFLRTPSIFDINSGLSGLGLSAVPSVNIAESEKDFAIELAAPGLEKKDFKVEVDNGILTVSSEKEREEEEERKNYRRKEYSYKSFSRSFDLPENSIPDKIDAHYENGILKLTLPKKEVTISKPKKEIKVA